MSSPQHLEPLPLPPGVSEAYIDCTSSCGLNFHILTAGHPHHPLVLFCHGFPELAFSWRKVLSAVAKAGYYCVAMDQRGYGRTTGGEEEQDRPDQPDEEVDLTQYTMTNLVRDLVCLVYKLGYTETAGIVGHDFGAVSSAMAALIRPDMFKATIQMSHPYHPPPSPQLGNEPPPKLPYDIQAELAKLSPPRKHYKWYNSSPDAAAHWNHPPQGLSQYLRGYFHLKSADWAPNHNLHPLPEWSAATLALMPEYYIMQLHDTFPSCIANNMQQEDFTKTESWLSQEDLAVYVGEWNRTGFQRALLWYRAQTASTEQSKKDLLLYAGARIQVPCAFISGKQDWGNWQQPGAWEGYEDEKRVRRGCFRGTTWIDGAGHWVQQERDGEVVKAVVKFLEML